MSLGFWVDFLTQVNFLNQSWQEKATTVSLVYKKIQDFRDKCRFLKSHLHQSNFFHFPQMKALIDSKEIQVDDITIILFSSVYDGVLQEFSNRFQDFERISDTTRLVAYPHQGYLELRDVKPRDQRFFFPSIVGLPATDRETCLLVSDSTWHCVLVVR